ncbi:hypothetical protein SteCoe_24021 [Stentor coeruleus]|uniref:Peptide deformylase n=1 Tax=Stentor coeruleus TaxID=5963 RepID=A0A1R2BIG7_9CILI|nr:hypothetical protein SteCoe_24021 [Stentor coeruleus]
MSHLKKLSDRLKQSFAPSIKKISSLETFGENDLEMYTSKVQFLSKKITDLYIPTLIKTASANNLSSLASNQISILISAFVIRNQLEPTKWLGYTDQSYDYTAYINPKILEVNGELINDYEQCPSFPYIKALIPRYDNAIVEYMNLEGEYVQECLKGFKARVFMHEFDHLEANLISSFTVNSGNIEIIEPEKRVNMQNVVLDFKNKLMEMVNRLEDRYLIDKEFKKKVEKKTDRTEFFIQQVVDEEFDAQFHVELVKAWRIDSLK